jgi:large subunit ribosomal protein L6
MSRIGRLPIPLPDGVTVDVAPGRVAVTGPKGPLEQAISPDMAITVGDGAITVARPSDRPAHRALHGLTRSLVANMVVGVNDGYVKELEIQGVGYRAQAKGKDLELALGYSHAITYVAPEGIDFEVPQPTQIIVRGIDKQRVGQVAAEIRKLRPPEPYKGKGIRYAGEHVARKVGKRA